MIVFLDLEETVINNWEESLLMLENIKKIKHLLDSNESVRVGLMSWAVWDDRDKTLFNAGVRHFLEENLGHRFDDELLWSMKDWAEHLFKFCGKHVSIQDLFDILGKHEVLFMLSRCHPTFRNETVMLIDDIAEHDLEWRSSKNNTEVRMVNVNAL
jgi:hypothetical protein